MDPDPTPDPTPFFSEFKDAKRYMFFIVFSYNLPTGTLSSDLKILKIDFFAKILCKILIFKHYFSLLNTLMRKGKDPNPDPVPYRWLMDPDPWGPKTCGCGSGSGSLTRCQSSGGDVLIFYDSVIDSDPDLNWNRFNRWIRLCVFWSPGCFSLRLELLLKVLSFSWGTKNKNSLKDFCIEYFKLFT